jgi:hypothetical protein
MDQELRIKLIELARQGYSVEYGKIMAEYGLSSNIREQVYVFADMIGEISKYEDEHKRPMLSSLVMHAGKETIGRGFYNLAEELGHGDQTYLRKIGFEKIMHERCFTCWADDTVYFQETGKIPRKLPVDPYPLILNDLPYKGYDHQPEHQYEFRGNDIDWLNNHLADLKVGDMGEELVIAYERRELIGNGFLEWAKEVKKVKDGEGYDIFSRDLTGKEKYIEVKTTLGNELTPFFLSENERQFSLKNSDKYYLYRLYNLDEYNKVADLNVYNGEADKCFFLSSKVYTAYPKKNPNI